MDRNLTSFRVQATSIKLDVDARFLRHDGDLLLVHIMLCHEGIARLLRAALRTSDQGSVCV